MTTRATRDVVDLNVRVIDATTGGGGIRIDGDNSPNFAIDGTTIGANTPGAATFVNATITSTLTFNAGSSMVITDNPLTVVGTLQANYADLAEYYESDEQYDPGTVVRINVDGDSEITSSKGDLDPHVLGIISTNPAYVLNAGNDGLYLPVAQVGRVPCLVHGPVKKGDRLVPCCVGHAQAVNNSVSSRDKMIIGRALESNDEQGVKLVEIVINTLK